MAFEDVSFRILSKIYFKKSRNSYFQLRPNWNEYSSRKRSLSFYHEYETFVEKFIERSQFNSQYAEIKKGDIFICHLFNSRWV